MEIGQKEETYFPKFEILSLPRHRSRLTNILDTMGATHRFPGCRVAEMVLGKQVSAVSTVVVEEEYVDRDHAVAYARCYARSFRAFERRCTRFHFFSSEIGWEELLAYGKKATGKLQRTYLGFSVLRPKAQSGVGRTVLPLLGASKQDFFPCKGDFHIDLIGHRLHATGTPFVERDHRVAACATSAIWMATMATSHRYRDLPFLSLTEISEGALDLRLGTDGQPIETMGLRIWEIQRALNRIGYDSVTYDKPTSSAWARDLIYKYLDSGIPPILLIALGGGLHAITAVGYRYDRDSAGPSRHPLLDHYQSSGWISHFYVHDDQLGPYREMKILPAVELQKGDFIVPVEIDWPTCPGPGPGFERHAQTMYENAWLMGIMAALPPRVFLSAEKAERKGWRSVYSAFHWHPEAKQPTEPVVRAYLIASNEFKERLNAEYMSERLLALYRGTRMSRYVWIVEVGERDERIGRNPNQVKI